MRKPNFISMCSFVAAVCGLLALAAEDATAQALRIPGGTNLSSSAGRRLAATDIDIHWNAPAVRGREGKIWGTDVANYGFMVLGYGSSKPSPWRAGADESTTISFSTDVKINGRDLAAGRYGFFIALYPDSCILIFNRNTAGWGSYFYDSTQDVLRVATRQQKDQEKMQERLTYVFENQGPESLDVALYWEKWRIPFSVSVDAKATTLAFIRAQMSGALGFDPPSLEAAADWCLRNKVNYDQALNWINSATDPSLGGVQGFRTLSVKAGLLAAMGRKSESDEIMSKAIENATVLELHGYGRQLLTEKKVTEAMAVFEKNFKKHKGAWPTHAGMMRGYSAMGDLKKALEHGRQALAQAPDEASRKSLEQAVKTLSEGKPL
jgi:tetratricopeptide (TPR) repeat protein